MRVLEPGHVYELEVQDQNEPETLTFVNREDNPHGGTQTQEVIRALIDRTMHCDNCLRWAGNDEIIRHLRMALVLHEARALQRKVTKDLIAPEDIATGFDGHFAIDSKDPSPDAALYNDYGVGTPSAGGLY